MNSEQFMKEVIEHELTVEETAKFLEILSFSSDFL